MTQLLSLSPVELVTSTEPADQAGAVTRVRLFEGPEVQGPLREFDQQQRSLRLQIGDADEERRIAFRDIREICFCRQIKAPPAVVAGVDTQTYHVNYRDGRMQHGLCRESRVDDLGLHLLDETEGGELQRLLIPMEAMTRYRVGDRQGQGRPAGTEPAPALAAIAQGRPISDADALRRILSDRTYFLNERHLNTPADSRRENETPADLAARLGVPYVDLNNFRVEKAVLQRLPESVVREHQVLPLLMFREHLVVAMENPANAELNSLLHFVSGMNIEGCVADRDCLMHAIDANYGAHEDSAALHDIQHQSELAESREMSLQEIERMGKEKPIVRMVNNILREAIHRNASDIHVRPGEKDVELLYRQDGSLVPVRRFDKALLQAVVARIKIIGRMNIAERRLPQDGRARMVEQGAKVDMRISVIPTVNGESVVVRLLNVQTGLRSISEIGFTQHDAELFTDLLHKSYGMVLVTGPTGSGKSTTLYAALQEVRKQNVNIITVEDPVEYHIEGIEQIPIHTAPDFTFARALRNILRHDPDVIMVGEIRDQETAKIAVESALTGHLVLSTLHTNDAPTTVMRLIEMGVESFLVKSSLLGVLAQRLVRINCPHCIEEEPVDEAVRGFLGIGPDEKFYHGRGCEACHQTGFHGRMAVYELLVMTAELRAMLRPDTSADEVRDRARADGMVSLTDNALKLARDHKISLAEVYRVRLE